MSMKDLLSRAFGDRADVNREFRPEIEDGASMPMDPNLGVPLHYQTAKNVIEWLITTMTPKNPQNGDNKAIQFWMLIGGKPFILCSYAPSNYRQIWWLYPEEVYKPLADDLRERMTKRDPYADNRLYGRWIKESDHDSCWRSDGIDSLLCKLSQYGRETVYLMAVRYGDVPASRESWDRKVCETRDGEHLFRLSESLDLTGVKDQFDLVIRLLATEAVVQTQDAVCLRFMTMDHKKDKTVKVLNSTELTRWERPNSVPVIANKTREGLIKLLGKGDWWLFSVDQYRPNSVVCFF